MKKVDLREKVLTTNEELAMANRKRFADTGTLVLNLVSSPGSGKTSLVEETVKILKDKYRIYVVTGDIMTENPAILVPGSDLRHVVEIMTKHKIGALPVVEKGSVIGIVTQTDLLKLLSEVMDYVDLVKFQEGR